MAADRHRTHAALGGIVGHAQAAVIEEAGERGPAIKAVLDCLGDLVLDREIAALCAQPPLQGFGQRPAVLLAHAFALIWRLAVDLALDREQHVNALDCLDRDRRLADPG